MEAMSGDINENCPGTESESAGKVSACEGCPNQQLCASGITREEDPGVALVRHRLRSVKHKILILSGKGGVGKSTFTSLLARFLAAKNEDKDVAICDVDICGPSMPRVMGALTEQVHQSGSGWSPVYVDSNLSLMSIGFLLENPDSAVIWRGPKKNAMIRQFLSDVDWGELEYLLIDTPPGTSDEHMAVSKYLNEVGLDGAIIITTPQEVALLDVRKEIDFCIRAGIRIIGVVENMTFFVCPKCLGESRIFPPRTGGAIKMCSDLNVDFLGSLPLDPRLARCCDEGRDFTTEYKDSPANLALEGIVENNPRSMIYESFALFAVAIILLSIQDCEGINCYTCSSVNGSNPYCEDPINTHMSNYTEKCMVPKKGHVGLFPANFCIKIVGKNTDTYERMVVRACVMKTMDSQCGMFRYQDQAMTGCVLTCDYNGCNKAERSKFEYYTFLYISVFLTFIRFC